MSNGERSRSGARWRRGTTVRGWKFRFDAPPPEGPGGAPRIRDEPIDILELFHDWQRSEAERAQTRDLARGERREAPRYEPVETQAYVGWWKGSRFLVANALLINLSSGGALVEVDRRPPLSQPVWLGLGTPRATHHVQARALEVSCVPGSPRRWGSSCRGCMRRRG